MKKYQKTDDYIWEQDPLPKPSAGTECCAVLFKEAYSCTLCFALCAFFPLIFSLVWQVKDRLCNQTSSFISARPVYHSLPHLDPETLKLLFCYVRDQLICSLASVYDRGEMGKLSTNRLSLRINNSWRDSWVHGDAFLWQILSLSCLVGHWWTHLLRKHTNRHIRCCYLNDWCNQWTGVWPSLTHEIIFAAQWRDLILSLSMLTSNIAYWPLRNLINWLGSRLSASFFLCFGI